MTVHALGGETALTISLAALPRAAHDRARPEPAEPKAPDPKDDRTRSSENATKPIDAGAEARDAEAANAPSEISEDREPALTATQLSVLYDKDIDRFISRRIDPQSGEVVRQFPYEEHLERLRQFAAQAREDADDRLDVRV